MDQKRSPAGDTPKVLPKTGLCSNLLFLAHSKDLLKYCKAFTQFVNEPRFGQNGPKIVQDGHKMAQDGFKTAPRWPKMASLAEGKAETGNWVALGCFGLLWAAAA